jgi:hypothetical protein
MTSIRPTGASLLPTASPAVAPSAAALPVSPSSLGGPQAIVADLQAARITADEAVARLTAHALAGAPASVRPAVEARVRATLASDPLLGALLRQIGVGAAREE